MLTAVEKEHDFGSTHLLLTGELRERVLEMASRIDDDDLHEKGREDDPHITIKFGLHTSDADEVAEIVKGFGDIEVVFGATSLFQSDEFDVVKVDVEGELLRELNALLSESLEVTDTHPTYSPHVTLAYLQPDRGESYTGMDDLESETATFSSITFSSKSDDTSTLTLKRKTVMVDIATATRRTSIIKSADEGDGVYLEGAVLVPEVVDFQGDIVSADEIRKAAYKYMATSQRAGEMHEQLISTSDATLVESRITKAIETIGESELPVGTWIVKFRITSDELQQKINDGEFAGFSIGGVADTEVEE